jgi:predicted O-linked N-acetylglucosamine transferase (SPINDLY family)
MTAELLATGWRWHQAGDLPRAEQAYRQFVQQEPGNTQGWFLLGVLGAARGDLATAIHSLDQVLRLQPDHADALHQRGMVLIRQQRFTEATASLRAALRVKPTDVEIQANLAIVLAHQGEQAEALALSRAVLRSQPDHGKAQSLVRTLFAQQAVAEGLNALQQGKLDEAAARFRQAIQMRPDFADAYANLGNALARQGKRDEAIASYQHALRLRPDLVEAHINLGIALRDQQKLQEAEASFRHAAQLRPELAEAHHSLGAALLDQGRLDEAIESFQRAVQLKPAYALAQGNLGLALCRRGRFQEAVVNLQEALRLKPDYAEIQTNLGLALETLAQQAYAAGVACLKLGKREEAVAHFQRALQLQPDFVEAHARLGMAFRDQKKLAEAEACYRAALHLRPDLAEVHNHLGVMLLEQDRPAEAIASFQHALQLQPGSAQAHNNLGNALRRLGGFEEALTSYESALQAQPDLAEVHGNRASVFRDLGRLDEAISAYRTALQFKPDAVQLHSSLVFLLQYHPDYDAEAILAEARRWNQQHAEPLRKTFPAHTNVPDPERRLRIGYVSPNFRDQAETYFTVSLLAAHDHRSFEIFCYADVDRPDKFTRHLQSHADVWRNAAGLSDPGLADLVRRDQIDILVDLTMHMANNRLLVFARKPAPVQVCWLAYQGTTGLSTMDYRLSDRHCDPLGLHDRFYSEQTIHLPDSFGCYDPLCRPDLSGVEPPPVNSLPAWENGYVTFGSLNHFGKINAPLLKLWANVLQTVERSRLLLLAREGSHRQGVWEFFEREGIARERVTFVASRPRERYLELYHRMDLGLDTVPYNGQTTSLDSFWMGVPVVTLVGRTAVGRAGLSLLQTLGLPELIAQTPEQYVTLAARLAGDLPRLAELRGTLRQRLERSPLMDAPRFAAHVEQAYRQMWRRCCQAQSPGAPGAERGQ